MQTVYPIDEVRRLVAEKFSALGVAAPDQARESILIRDGNYCGRRFEAETASAVWFAEEHEIKFYQADGSVACVIEPAVAEFPPTRMAA